MQLSSLVVLLFTSLNLVQAQNSTCVADTDVLVASIVEANDAVLATLDPTITVLDDEIDIAILAGAESTEAFVDACTNMGGESHVEASHLLCPATDSDGAATEAHIDLPLILCLADGCTEEDEEEIAHEVLEAVVEAALAGSTEVNITGECIEEGHDEHDDGDHDDHDHEEEESGGAAIALSFALASSVVVSFFS